MVTPTAGAPSISKESAKMDGGCGGGSPVLGEPREVSRLELGLRRLEGEG
jgi:hypothetical protein